jgi:hypothetical protein
MPESIIVYRNPMEQRFWESVMNSDGMFTMFIVFIVVALLTWIGSYHIFNWIAKRLSHSNDSDTFCGLGATIVAGISVWLVITKIM